jgi:(1->4)-alpha-D-glucan 1-alpha-D-glucosylmutase
VADVRATYRVQLHQGFTFHDAAALAGYLAALGISHLYCSPYLHSRPGSTHGYDVVDHRRVDPELGGEEGLERMVAALEAGGLGHIVDIVPNHMAIAGRSNAWWWDVLKRGAESEYAGFFDINWAPSDRRLGGRILAPILGDHYGRELAAGNIRIDWVADQPVFRYFDNEFPLSDETAAAVADHDYDLINRDKDRLHDLLERQHYRLAFWKTAGQDLPYRRFFAINELVALRVDRNEVFHAVHELVLRLLHEQKLDGVRIDHIDGLRDPQGYLERLRDHVGNRYMIVEKILEPGEEMPPTWPVDGSTGYDFLSLVHGIFVDPDGVEPLSDLYASFTKCSLDLDDELTQKKALLLSTELGSDLERLTDLFVQACEKRLEFRDFTRSELRDALEAVATCFPVYRTYVSERDGSSPQDLRFIRSAVAAARARTEDLDPEIFGFLEDILTMRYADEFASALALRFQQLTGPVMAKGVEDTAFYTFNRFVSLNEVGGHPGSFGISPDTFHRANAERSRSWPRSMLTTSTHDTKRSEDVRARLALLSEIPDGWADAVQRWSAMNDRHRREEMPDRNMEYLLYQTLVGAWPITADRIASYMEKAAKEAKTNTSWIAPNRPYDEALRNFVVSTMHDDDFLSDVGAFVEPLIEPGWVNSLAQCLLKLTAPGVPDIYQGCELWDLSLVDPDNRRPVDYDVRRKLAHDLIDASPEEAWTRAEQGAPKLYLTQKALQVRHRSPHAFGIDAAYTPLAVSGERADSVIAFGRAGDVAVVVPRLVLGVGTTWGGGPLTIEAHRKWTDWADTVVRWGPGDWVNVLTDEEFGDATNVSFLFERFPVALLTRETS